MRRTSTAFSGLALTAALVLTGCAGGADEEAAGQSTASGTAPSITTENGGSQSASALEDPQGSATASSSDGRLSSESAAAASSEASSAAASGSASSSPAAGGSATGAASSAGPVSAEHSMGDVMFAQMMIPHHEQAVEMSDIVLAKDGVPADVRALAQQIKDAQAPEIERMKAMLEAWGTPYDEGMDHSGHGGMSGMLSESDLQELDDADGPASARLFLEGMVDHHEGAVEMAQQHQDEGENPQALELSTSVISSQQKEIDQMKDMLARL